MGLSGSIAVSGGLGLLQARVRELPRALLGSIRKPNGRAIKRTGIALGLIAFALVSGTWAYEKSFDEAMEQWERTHPPSASVWSYSLGMHGFRPITEVLELHRAVRTLPVTVDATGSIWLSLERRWVAIFTGSDVVVFGWERAPGKRAAAPEGWEPMGRGWSGFESTLDKITEAKLEPEKIVKSSRRDMDPRAIRY